MSKKFNEEEFLSFLPERLRKIYERRRKVDDILLLKIKIVLASIIIVLAVMIFATVFFYWHNMIPEHIAATICVCNLIVIMICYLTLLFIEYYFGGPYADDAIMRWLIAFMMPKIAPKIVQEIKKLIDEDIITVDDLKKILRILKGDNDD